MGLLSKILGMQDFNGLQDGVAVVQLLVLLDGVIMVCPLIFSKNLIRNDFWISSCAELKRNIVS